MCNLHHKYVHNEYILIFNFINYSNYIIFLSTYLIKFSSTNDTLVEPVTQ